jgi:hypothetical protein
MVSAAHSVAASTSNEAFVPQGADTGSTLQQRSID